MKIKYIGVRTREIATARGITVRPGDVVEVGETLGASLLRQATKFVEVLDPATPPAQQPDRAQQAAQRAAQRAAGTAAQQQAQRKEQGE